MTPESPRPVGPTLVLALASLVARGGTHPHLHSHQGTVTVPGLGTVSFPVSTTVSTARGAFLRGVLLLHLFEYADAARAFREAERADPGFAMAYWGEAMTYDHPVWNEEDPEAARAALERLAPTPAARQQKAPTARERGYLGAVERLWGEGSKERRDSLYSQAMGRLLAAYPADDEARLFYALSLLGLGQGVRDPPSYARAAAIAESVFVRHPTNPGAAHYLIHAVDDPDHARGGMAAARTLARVAVAADHAQHMTSHIFVALGMWDEVVRANEAAMRVVNATLRARNRGPLFCRHYNVWLDYGYVELGRMSEARRLLARCREQAARAPAASAAADGPDVDTYSFITMWSHYLLASGRWTDSVAGWSIDPGQGLGPRLTYWFTRGFGAARRGDVAAARAALGAFGQAEAETERWVAESPNAGGDLPELPRARVLRAELEGLIAGAEGESDAELAALRRATLIEDSMAYAFGPPFVNEPAHEVLGSELLRLHRFEEARTQFRLALGRTPRRTAALLGLARACAALDDTASAARTYAELDAIWHDADAGAPGVLEARDYGHRPRGGG